MLYPKWHFCFWFSTNTEMQTEMLILRNTDIHRFIELFWDTTDLSTKSANGISKIYDDKPYTSVM